MRIAVLSGKGGTGKTFVSVNLAYAVKDIVYIDCDVEEPNGGLFLKPLIEREEIIEVMEPSVDNEKCNGCKKCVDFCQYNALAYVNDQLLIFNELCHSCRGCVLLCPEKALAETKRGIGQIEYGKSADVKVRTGILNPGEANGIPIIQKLLRDAAQEKTVVIDCPPGSSCAVMESIKDSDYCILVAEPTLFGVHNLSMVYELVKLFDKPYGVVLNKTVEGETIAEDYCRENNIPILMRIPYDPEIALLNSRGEIAAAHKVEHLGLFEELLGKITGGCSLETTSCTKW
ncbi:MAG: ATP-binding protein [Syntrophomonadaceae bacterium]|nr:ATP-binding protein [Syntrophomonadaceae bacterium]MDD3889032.1 ATP-binding protein [Syntrophomonadaceae bacterium]MDD4549247.1 ATP-binding protein [Syntrophomonadaceae bacterium]